MLKKIFRVVYVVHRGKPKMKKPGAMSGLFAFCRITNPVVFRAAMQLPLNRVLHAAHRGLV